MGLFADPIMRAAVVVFGLLVAAYVLPILSQDTLVEFSAVYVQLALNACVVVAAQYRIRRIDHPEERWFLNLVSLAFVSWFAVDAMFFWFGFHKENALLNLLGDGFYLLTYLGLIVALEQKPHLAAGWTRGELTHRFATFGTILFVFTLLGYFVIVPSTLAF